MMTRSTIIRSCFVCVFCCINILLFFGCSNNTAHTVEGLPDVDQENGWGVISPPSTIPQISWSPTFKIETVNVNYVYLTDGSGNHPLTLVQEGDVFLGWYVDSVKAQFEVKSEGSIAYTSIGVRFAGEAEVEVSLLEYYDMDEAYINVYATSNDSSLPALPFGGYDENPGVYFNFRDSPELERLIADVFYGKAGVINDCKIIIRDFEIAFAFTDVIPCADFVELVEW